ncbi:MAG: hypothetical protein M1830_009515 [Pleopsidium flavum]|nr:MAG: hypothetical protein M1830_009515 [Pleopsidium flavum]
MADEHTLPPAPAADVTAPAATDHSDETDADSAYGHSGSNSETASLVSEITKYREENGRTYHTYGSTEHWGPNDALAQDQQDLRDVADQHPQADVKGIDLSPIQPSWIPPNCRFEIDDYNIEWLDDEKYDLIHARELLGTISDWPGVIENCFKALKPGGWIDHAEPGLFFVSDYDTLDEGHAYHQWGKLMSEAGDKAGMSFAIGPMLKGWLEDAGFINVTERRVPWTIGKWSKDPHERDLGQWNQLRLERGIQDFCARRFTNKMSWRPEEVEVFCARMRAAIKNPRLLAYQLAYFVYGQKPPRAETQDDQA